MADEATCHYEDVINEMSLGAKFIYDEFGVRPTVGWHVDPFGHSSQMASLYHDMGFDVFAFWRIHYDDVNERKATQKLEFVWRGSQSSGAKSDVFSHYLDSGYGSPGECDFFANSGGECYYWTGDDRWLQWDDDLPTYAVLLSPHSLATRTTSSTTLSASPTWFAPVPPGSTTATTSSSLGVPISPSSTPSFPSLTWTSSSTT